MGRLTTHVLDTASGRPASELTVTLFRVVQDSAVHYDSAQEKPGFKRVCLKKVVTNKDGRTDSLLQDSEFLPGTYEIEFRVDEYFQRIGAKCSDPAFFDCITVRFTISDATTHYHVPLLVSPWSYTTYRGS